MRRLMWLPLAGFLLIAGAAIAAAAPTVTPSNPLSAATLSDASETDEPGTPDGPRALHVDGLLRQVLADLVDEGVITQAQSDAIVEALQDKADELRSDAQRRRDLLRSFVEDGVISQAEIDQLAADDPLRQAFDSIADDGQISVDQLHELGRGLMGPGFGPGMGHGPGMRHGPGPGMGPWVHGPSDKSSDKASDDAPRDS